MASVPFPVAQVSLVPHGAGAREALWRAVAAAKEADPLRAVTVAVPSPYAGLSLRRELGSRTGLVNVRFLSLARVAALIGAPALAAERRPLTRALEAEAVHATLAAEPGPFAGVADHPSTARSLAATFADLRRSGGTLTALDGLGPRAAAVGRLYTRFRELTRAFYDEEDMITAATAALIGGAGTAAAELGHTIVWLATELSPGEEAFVRALLAAGAATVVLGLTGDTSVDDTHARALATRLGTGGQQELPLVDKAEPPRELAVDAPIGTHVLSAPDPEDEVRAVARRVMERASDGIALHEIAVVFRLDEPYARLVPEIFDSAGIAWNGPSPRRLSDSVLARVLLGILRLADPGSGHDLPRDDVAAWLSSGPVRDPVEGHRVPSARWDVVSREAGVVAGAPQWAERLAHHRAELSRELDEARAGNDSPEWRIERLESDRDTVERLASFINGLTEAITPPTEPTWSAHARWAQGLVNRYLGGEGQRSDWPEPELEAARRVSAALAGLGALDEVAASGVYVARFRRALGGELDVAFGRVERFGTGVFVGRLHHAYGTRFRTVFVLGMAESTFPPRGHEDPLLPDRDRRVVGLGLHAERHHVERRDYLATLAAATERVLCFPRADARAQRQRLPARWLLETARALDGCLLGAEDVREMGPGPWLDVVASFEAGLACDAEPGSESEYDLRSLGEWRSAFLPLSEHPLATGILGAGVAAIAARSSDKLTEHDGFVGAAHGLAPDVGRAVSPTALQEWAKCPFSYFLSRVLRVSEVTKPEVTETISALDEGTLVHGILEEFVATAAPRTAPSQPWSDEERALLLQIADRHCDDAEQRGITGRALQWELARRRVMQTALRFAAIDEVIRASTGALPAPDGLELGFGNAGGTPVSITLTDGRVVAFHGRIDRVDVSPERDRVIVYDYKTGRPYRIDEADPVDAGRRLQLPVYAVAAAAHTGIVDAEAHYWFTAADPELTLQGSLALDEVLRDRFTQVVGTIADGLGAGSFPAVPGGPDFNPRTRRDGFTNCFYCPYDRLCPPDRLTSWERKASDPAMEPYNRLEPADEDGGR